MDEKKVDGVTELSDEQLEPVAGGWIVDMGPQEDDSYSRYAYCDFWGNVQTYTTTLADAEYVAENNRLNGGFYYKTLMTLEQYEERFGHSL